MSKSLIEASDASEGRVGASAARSASQGSPESSRDLAVGATTAHARTAVARDDLALARHSMSA